MILLGFAAVPAVVVIAGWMLNRRISDRKALNLTLSAASEEFYTTANSILKTPHELPDDVLDIMAFMSRAINTDGSAKSFLRVIRLAQRGNSGATQVVGLATMRPELQDLFGKLTRAWVLVMLSSSTRYNRVLSLELMKLVAGHHKTEITTRDGVRAASQMMGCAA